MLAAISVAVRALVLFVFFVNSVTPLRNRGRSFLALVVYAAATITVGVFYASQTVIDESRASFRAFSCCWDAGCPFSCAGGSVRVGEAHWVTSRLRLGPAGRARMASRAEGVLHVPAYNEPPTWSSRRSMHWPGSTIQLRSAGHRQQHARGVGLAACRAHCARLGERFRLSSMSRPRPVSKQEPLNFALRQTARMRRLWP